MDRDAVQALKITENQTKLVTGTTLLHQILTEPVVPMDRTYTAPFLIRCQADHFQTERGQQKTCRLAFNAVFNRRQNNKSKPIIPPPPCGARIVLNTE